MINEWKIHNHCLITWISRSKEEIMGNKLPAFWMGLFLAGIYGKKKKSQHLGPHKIPSRKDPSWFHICMFPFELPSPDPQQIQYAWEILDLPSGTLPEGPGGVQVESNHRREDPSAVAVTSRSRLESNF